MKYFISGLIALGITLGCIMYFGSPSQGTNVASGSITTGQYGNATSSLGTGTTAATSTLIGTTSRTVYITDISASSDLAGAIVKIKDGSANVIWQAIIGTSSPYVVSFNTPLRSTAGNSFNATVTGTNNAIIDLSGYYTP